MTLDKNKKYEFCGEVYRWSGGSEFEGVWSIGNNERITHSWPFDEFEFFASKGLVKEVPEPIVGRGRVSFNGAGDWVSPGTVKGLCGLTEDQARNRTFDIVATEVVE